MALLRDRPEIDAQQIFVLGHSLGGYLKQVELVKDPNRLPTGAAADLPFNVPAAYWLDLNAYQPEKVAQTLNQPMLFLQGEGDLYFTSDIQDELVVGTSSS